MGIPAPGDGVRVTGRLRSGRARYVRRRPVGWASSARRPGSGTHVRNCAPGHTHRPRARWGSRSESPIGRVRVGSQPRLPPQLQPKRISGLVPPRNSSHPCRQHRLAFVQVAPGEPPPNAPPARKQPVHRPRKGAFPSVSPKSTSWADIVLCRNRIPAGFEAGRITLSTTVATTRPCSWECFEAKGRSNAKRGPWPVFAALDVRQLQGFL